MRTGLCLTTALATSVVLAAGASAQQEFTLRGFGGAIFSPEASGDFSVDYGGYDLDGSLDFDLENGWIIGGAAGVNVTDFTFEGEVAFRSSSVESLTASYAGYSYSYPADADVEVTSILANGWYNVPLGEQWVGYGGGGIGVASADIGSYDGDYKFAWQLGIGLKYAMSEQMTLGVGYRYFQVSDIIEDQVDVLGYAADFASDYSDNAIIAEIGFTF